MFMVAIFYSYLNFNAYTNIERERERDDKMSQWQKKNIEAVNDDSVKTKATMTMTTAKKASFPSSSAPLMTMLLMIMISMQTNIFRM